MNKDFVIQANAVLKDKTHELRRANAELEAAKKRKARLQREVDSLCEALTDELIEG